MKIMKENMRIINGMKIIKVSRCYTFARKFLKLKPSREQLIWLLNPNKEPLFWIGTRPDEDVEAEREVKQYLKNFSR